jgi:hypothetical protein
MLGPPENAKGRSWQQLPSKQVSPIIFVLLLDGPHHREFSLWGDAMKSKFHDGQRNELEPHTGLSARSLRMKNAANPVRREQLRAAT